MTKSVVIKKETPIEWVQTMMAERAKVGLVQKLSTLHEENQTLKRFSRNNKDNFTADVRHPTASPSRTF